MTRPTFRMSESGKCPKALSAQLLGYEPTPAPVWLETAANEGKWHEDRIRQQLMEGGCSIGDIQEEFKLEYPSFDLIGHVDGIVITPVGDGKQKLLEIKSMSQFEFDRWMRDGFKGFSSYASQISCYMEATKLGECLYIVKNRSSGYKDRRVLTEKPKHMTEVIGHLAGVANHVLANELVPKDLDPQSLECRRCEYKHLCVPEIKELTEVEEAVLDEAAKDWRQGTQLVSEGQELIDTARGVFENQTRVTNTFKWRHLELAIQLVHYRESKTYPKANLLQIFTEEQLEPASKIKEAYDQLRIDDLAKEQ